MADKVWEGDPCEMKVDIYQIILYILWILFGDVAKVYRGQSYFLKENSIVNYLEKYII